MTREEMLIGYLCIFRINITSPGDFVIPGIVIDELESKEWISLSGNQAEITDLGYSVSDLHGADWELEVV